MIEFEQTAADLQRPRRINRVALKQTGHQAQAAVERAKKNLNRCRGLFSHQPLLPVVLLKKLLSGLLADRICRQQNAVQRRHTDGDQDKQQHP